MEFKDKCVFYHFTADESEGTGLEEFCADDLEAVLLRLCRTGPDAMLRMALRKPYVNFMLSTASTNMLFTAPTNTGQFLK